MLTAAAAVPAAPAQDRLSRAPPRGGERGAPKIAMLGGACARSLAFSTDLPRITLGNEQGQVSEPRQSSGKANDLGGGAAIKEGGGASTRTTTTTAAEEGSESEEPSRSDGRVLIEGGHFRRQTPHGALGIAVGCFAGVGYGFSVGFGVLTNVGRNVSVIRPSRVPFAHDGALAGCFCGVALGSGFGSGIARGLGYAWSMEDIFPFQLPRLRLRRGKIGLADSRKEPSAAAAAAAAAAGASARLRSCGVSRGDGGERRARMIYASLGDLERATTWLESAAATATAPRASRAEVERPTSGWLRPPSPSSTPLAALWRRAGEAVGSTLRLCRSRDAATAASAAVFAAI